MYILISPSKSQNTKAPDAIHFFTGLVFKQLNFKDYDAAMIKYLYEHIIILSDKYGYLRAGEHVAPHRPELKASVAKKLRPLVTEFLKRREKPILNLSSKEYSQLIAEDIEVYDLDFGKRPSVHIKKARGKILDYCIRNQITDPRQIDVTNPLFWEK